MRLIVLVFYFVIGYLVWRFLRSVLRGTFSGGTPPAPKTPTPKEGSASRDKMFREADIKDAEFEDITSPPGTSSKDSAH